ncbi:uncharacterized protein BJ171DRAFT_518092 [Polychytrium aggregatum]|uniref:uncharacterized protein n=1 Tax=Polychytrium aggregatum TaxID=110093 RepID=UPI0022FDD714|nr:uncharacterized protein BJ171DRAFT_518092 [Polychytrium aggregatum]KAI9199620.1 hypothetical protein BJ171DRAFT_518092 [Polychytrium aggregatum]
MALSPPRYRSPCARPFSQAGQKGSYSCTAHPATPSHAIIAMATKYSIKVWLNDDCRRFIMDSQQLSMEALRSKIYSVYGLKSDEPYVIKFKDSEGDLVTLSTMDELEDLLTHDLRDSDRTIKLHMLAAPSTNRSPSSTTVPTSPSASISASISTNPFLDSGFADDLWAISDDTEHSSTPADRIRPDVSKEMMDILRDLSYYICARDLTPFHSRVTSEKSLITPNSITQKIGAAARKFDSKIPMMKSIARSGLWMSQSSMMDFRDWSVTEVSQWLSATGLEDLSQSFRDHDINGEVLSELSHDILKDMGISSSGKRLKILKLVNDMKDSIAA